MLLCGADICMLSFGGSACLPDVLPAGCRDIDDMLMKLPVRTHGDLQLHHELLCAKEAVLCMEDTKTVSDLPVCFVSGDCIAGHVSCMVVGCIVPGCQVPTATRGTAVLARFVLGARVTGGVPSLGTVVVNLVGSTPQWRQ